MSLIKLSNIIVTIGRSAPDAEVGRGGGRLWFLLSWIMRCLCEHHRLHREQHLRRRDGSRTVSQSLIICSSDRSWDVTKGAQCGGGVALGN